MPREYNPFQKDGIKFLARRPRGNAARYLADDPGTGKTVQVCGGINEVGAKTGLIICPDPIKIKEHWQTHLYEWSGISDVFINTKTDERIPNAPWVVTGYSMLQYPAILDQLKERRHSVLVCDEAHKLKFAQGIRTRAVMGNKGDNLKNRSVYTWYLSGTPICNRPLELFPILSSSIPEALGKYKDAVQYGKRYCSGWLDDYGWNFNGASNIDELAQMLADCDFMLRREINDVAKDLPPVIETRHYFDIGDIGFDEHNTLTPTLRREIGLAKAKDENILAMLRENLSADKKLVVVAYHRDVIQLLQDRLSQYNPVVINGDVSDKEKKKAFQYFLTHDNCKGIILQFKSGGTSFDGLQFVCNNYFIVEPDWSAGDWSQLYGRLRRIGQTKPVNAVIAIAGGTLDEPMLGSVGKKQKVIANILAPTKENSRMADGLLERGITALESIAESLKGIVKVQATNPGVEQQKQAAPAPAATPKSGNGKAAAQLTVDEVREVANDAICALVAQKMKQEDAVAIISAAVKEHGGAATLDKVAKGKLEAVRDAFQSIIDNPNVEDVPANPASLI